MTKTILITGATDGIGLETARLLAADGHHLLIHGRTPAKLERVADELSGIADAGPVESFCADLSRMAEVTRLAEQLLARDGQIDIVINNAGILKAPTTTTADGLDVRFAVNTLAPYLLTRHLLDRMAPDGRVVNLSSAAQAPVSLDAMAGQQQLSDMDAYAQSKLAITMWSRQMAEERTPGGPVVVAVNPGSLLASKMVKEGFGVAGNDLSVGANILIRAALAPEFADASGKYFDNDAGHFGPPHRDALDTAKTARVVAAIEDILNTLTAA